MLHYYCACGGIKVTLKYERFIYGLKNKSRSLYVQLLKATDLVFVMQIKAQTPLVEIVGSHGLDDPQIPPFGGSFGGVLDTQDWKETPEETQGMMGNCCLGCRAFTLATETTGKWMDCVVLISLCSVSFFFQAKEQGKADVEELLSKLEKVIDQAYQINVHVQSCSFPIFVFTVLCFFQTNSEQQVKIQELQDKLSKVNYCLGYVFYVINFILKKNIYSLYILL